MKQSPRSTEITVCRELKVSLLPTLAPEELRMAILGERGVILAQCYLDRLHVLTLIKALQNWVEGE